MTDTAVTTISTSTGLKKPQTGMLCIAASMAIPHIRTTSKAIRAILTLMVILMATVMVTLMGMAITIMDPIIKRAC